MRRLCRLCYNPTFDVRTIYVLNDLEAQSDLFPFSRKFFWLFAKTGFTNKLTNEAEKRDDVRLIRFEDMA